jgi:signal transduction histidine kinase/CheY-like chemotaxis protein
LSAKVYIAFVTTSGVAVAMRAALTSQGHRPFLWTMVTIAAIAGSLLKVKLPGILGTISVGHVFTLLAVVELSPSETILTGTVAVLAQLLWRPKQRPRLFLLAFNAAVIVLTVAVASLAYRVPLPSGLPAEMVLRLGLSATAYFLVNSSLIMTVIALTEASPAWKVWQDFAWSFPNYLLGASLVAAFERLKPLIGAEVVLLILPVAYGIYRYYRLYNQHIADLEESKRRAEQASRLKSEFLVNMSHEIRTPMNGIMGMTDLALTLAKDKEQKEYLQLARTSADSLMSILNDILDLSHIEAGRLTIAPVTFDPRALIGETVKLLQVTARGKGLDIRVECSSNIPSKVIADSLRLRQILVNLIGNAVKFTETGHVDVQLRFEEEPARLRCEVRDTGIGIPRDKQAAVFEPFRQADGSMTRNYGGTGLGLAISSELLKLMGGEIRLESEPGRGTTFEFSVPCGVAAEAVETGFQTCPMTTASGHLDILLVEDNPVNQRLAARMLEKKGHSITVADNGLKALEVLENRTFDLVLMDVQMPVMDGYEATAAIRRREQGDSAHVPIIALTANAMAGDRERCLAAGMDGYVSKPVSIESLLREIAAIQEKYQIASPSQG